MEILKAIIFGIVEGITEWLPISSTGHMIILDEFLKLSVTEEFKNLFLVVIQLGAIMAVVILFWNKLWPFAITTNKKITVQKSKLFHCFLDWNVSADRNNISGDFKIRSNDCWCFTVRGIKKCRIWVYILSGGLSHVWSKLFKDYKIWFPFCRNRGHDLIKWNDHSIIVSMIVIKVFMKYVKGHNFNVFGWYRIALGICVLLLGMFGIITV